MRTQTLAADTIGGIFESLGPLDAIAVEPDSPRERLQINTHIHLPPNFSAFDTVHQATDLAAAEEIALLGVSNYYDYSVYTDFTRDCARRRIFPLYGIEVIALLDDLAEAGIKLNDPGNPGKMYLCGKGIARFDPLTPEAERLLSVIRTNDSRRMAAMTDRVAALFAESGLETGLNEAAVKGQVVLRHGSPPDTVYLQERHVAQAFQEALFARTEPAARAELLQRLFGSPAKSPLDNAAAVQNEIRSQLMKAGRPAFVPETFVGFDHAYLLVLALGGIPCYPVLADGASPISPFEAPVESLIRKMQERGIYAAEFIPPRNDARLLADYVGALRAAGIVVTAGTEHNTRDLINLVPECAGGEAIPEPIREIFWEGACVAAAHQVLVLQNRPGFVDPEGVPNSAYPSAEGRIAAFRDLGEAIIGRYRERLAG